MSGLGRNARADTEIENVRTEFGAEQHMVMTGPAVNTPDYQIVPSAMPGIIVEAVFLSNDEDAAWIVQPQNQRIVVEAYVRGINDYFERYPA
jgi:N-acetylmuramoyl-L-alanine amidase